MFEILTDVYCEGIFGVNSGIPGLVGDLVHLLYIGIQIVVPILLILFGMIDLGRAITAKKEEDIKKNQSSCVKRLITGVLVFVVAIIVEFILGFVAPKNGDSGDSPVKCALEIIKGKGNSVTNVTNR